MLCSRAAIGRSQQLVRRFAAAASSPAAPAKPAGAAAGPVFNYQDVFQPATKLETPFKKLTGDYVKTITVDGQEVLQVDPKALTLLANQAMIDIAHLLRPAHLKSLSNILKDPEASPNDKFVALELLKNANIASHMILPGCQDTGTAIIQGKKGQFVWTKPGGMTDEEALSKGVFNAYRVRTRRQTRVLSYHM